MHFLFSFTLCPDVDHVDMVPVSCITDPIELLASTSIHDLPPGCPTWAARLRDCEVMEGVYIMILTGVLSREWEVM